MPVKEASAAGENHKNQRGTANFSTFVYAKNFNQRRIYASLAYQKVNAFCRYGEAAG